MAVTISGNRNLPGTFTGVRTGDRLKGLVTFEEGNPSYYATYSGDLVGRMLHGQGVLTYTNGGRVEGGWKGGDQHGHCTCYDGEGFVVESRTGEYKDGKQVCGLAFDLCPDQHPFAPLPPHPLSFDFRLLA